MRSLPFPGQGRGGRSARRPGRGHRPSFDRQRGIDNAEPSIGTDFADRPVVEAAIRNALGTSYFYLGDAKAAVRQLVRARELRTTASDPATPTHSPQSGSLLTFIANQAGSPRPSVCSSST